MGREIMPITDAPDVQRVVRIIRIHCGSRRLRDGSVHSTAASCGSQRDSWKVDTLSILRPISQPNWRTSRTTRSKQREHRTLLWMSLKRF